MTALTRILLKGQQALLLGISILALGATAYGMYRAIHSPLFTVKVVEVSGATADSPVDAMTLETLAAVPVGQANLFQLDLAPIEKRLLSNSWVREVRLHKRFPQTLAISVTFREPQALMQSQNGVLSYVDADGTSFGSVNLMTNADLPLLSGLEGQPTPRVREALQLLGAWSDSELKESTEISSLAWDTNKGFRLWITYPGPKPSGGRALVELGQEIDDATLSEQFARLSKVLRYLSSNSIAARQIWADTGKKIVVKTAHGS